jgi:hypothetical protein
MSRDDDDMSLKNIGLHICLCMPLNVMYGTLAVFPEWYGEDCRHHRVERRARGATKRVLDLVRQTKKLRQNASSIQEMSIPK